MTASKVESSVCRIDVLASSNTMEPGFAALIKLTLATIQAENDFRIISCKAASAFDVTGFDAIDRSTAAPP